MAFKAPVGGYTVLECVESYLQRTQKPYKATKMVKQQIGAIVRDRFFSRPKRFAGKRKVQEAEGTFEVLVYPAFFKKEMDSLIDNYFKLLF